MSGIAGIIGKKNVKEKYEKKFLKMIKTLTHRVLMKHGFF